MALLLGPALVPGIAVEPWRAIFSSPAAFTRAVALVEPLREFVEAHTFGGPVSTDPEQRIPTDTDLSEVCEKIAKLAITYNVAIATAESLTAGNVASMLGKASSSGQWYRGGIVAYHEDVKHTVLQVPDGPVVSEQAAATMARSTATLLGADLAVALTGEAGPQSQEAEPPGTVWIALYDRGDISTECKHFDGEPEKVLAQTLSFSLGALLRHIRIRAQA